MTKLREPEPRNLVCSLVLVVTSLHAAGLPEVLAVHVAQLHAFQSGVCA